MVWHGGLSGSAPLKVAETGHLASLSSIEVPDFIATNQTILSLENLIVFGLLLVIMPILFLILKRFSTSKDIQFEKSFQNIEDKAKPIKRFSFENSRLPALGFGVLILIAFVVQYRDSLAQFRLTPNMLNFFMLGLVFILHGNFHRFLKALQQSIGDVSGILIQFPLYFGIMGIMKDSGLR